MRQSGTIALALLLAWLLAVAEGRARAAGTQPECERAAQVVDWALRAALPDAVVLAAPLPPEAHPVVAAARPDPRWRWLRGVVLLI